MKSLCLLVLATLISFCSSAVTIYVDINATGANSGANWTDAFTDVQDAIALSTFGDDIWVAQGTYKTTQGTSRNIYFNFKNGTKAYGGFTGIETALNQRDPEINVTTLSGEIGSGSATDNSLHVLRFNNIANQTRVDGFTIAGAYNTSGYGGGARVIDSSPVIANCKFVGNHAGEGGGALNHSGSGVLTLESCIFDGNVGNMYGGGALRLYSATVNISDCYFKSNQSDTYGGAIFIYGSTVTIDNSVFAGNICSSTGSAIRISSTGTLHLSNSLLVGNFAGQVATIRSDTFSNSASHTITNCTIAHNKQDNSGGSSTASTVALNDEATITNSIIYGNNSGIQVLGTGLTFNYNITENATNNATGSNIQYTDPQFVAPGNVNTAPFDTTGLDYQLDILSEGIDVGSNASVSGSTDLAGNTRIHNSTVDLGALEAQFCPSTSQFTTSAPFTICAATSITLEVDNGVNHLWSNGSTANSINVTLAGTYSVIFEDASGCRGNLSANVTTSPNPIPTIAFTGGTLDAGSFSSYQWSFNGTPIGGSTNSTHTPVEGYGLYEVVVQNAGGCEGSATYCLSPAAINADGPTTFCEGDDVTLYVTDGDSYVWSTSSLDSSITVNTSDTYSVTVLNSTAGCSVVLEQDVVVNPNPTPSITFDGQEFTTSTFTTYQWNFNGSPISGATSQNLDPTSTGNGQYTVTVTNANGCEATSTVYDLDNLGNEEIDLSMVKIYPNPVMSGSELTFEFAPSTTFDEIEIYNTAGVKVFTTKLLDAQNTINLPPLERGMYFITLRRAQQAISGVKLTVL